VYQKKESLNGRKRREAITMNNKGRGWTGKAVNVTSRIGRKERVGKQYFTAMEC